MSTTIASITASGSESVSYKYPLPTIESPLANVDKIDVNANGTTYYGTAASGTATSAAGWQIQASSVTGVITTFLWADGNVQFDNIWDNRTSLSYA